MFRNIFAVLGLALALGFVTTATHGQSSEVEFELRSHISQDMWVSFFSEGRQISPSDPARSFRLPAGGTGRYSMRCSFLEFVCYGAESVDRQIYSGRGLSGEETPCTYNASLCCIMCGFQSSVTININRAPM